MASESSFDIVSKVDKQEVSNALHQAQKEVSQRATISAASVLRSTSRARRFSLRQTPKNELSRCSTFSSQSSSSAVFR